MTRPIFLNLFQLYRLAGRHLDRPALPAQDTHPDSLADIAPYRRLDRTVLPGDVGRDPAMGAKPAHRTPRPGSRQGRQQVDGVAPALQQHFRNAGGRAEVAVNLERRMGIEQVGVGAAARAVVGPLIIDQAELARQQLQGAVAVPEAGPLVDLPAQAPAGSVVAARFQAPAAGLGQLRRLIGVIRRAGCKRTGGICGGGAPRAQAFPPTIPANVRPNRSGKA